MGHENEFFKVFKQRLIDMDMQALNMDIREMDRLRTYKILKVRFGTEDTYLIGKIGHCEHFLRSLEEGY